jgi:hypothetical protein
MWRVLSALQNITKQITDRKQRADQIIWDTLFDVVYLRTGNGVVIAVDDGKKTEKNVVTAFYGRQRSVGSDETVE